ncbi:MAG: alpha/beta hydrolase, partial [Bacteroidota bacterium]
MKTEYRGTKLCYEETGEGRPIILLHGFLENSSMWDYIPQSVFSTNRIIRIDLLGHGQSGCIGYVHSMEDMAMAVLFIAEELNLDKFKIIGHSMGGYVALAIARIKPKSVVGICLLNSTFLTDDRQRKHVRKRAIEMAKSNYEALVRMSFVNLFAENSRRQFSTEISRALKEALKTSVQGYIAAQEG